MKMHDFDDYTQQQTKKEYVSIFFDMVFVSRARFTFAVHSIRISVFLVFGFSSRTFFFFIHCSWQWLLLLACMDLLAFWTSVYQSLALWQHQIKCIAVGHSGSCCYCLCVRLISFFDSNFLISRRIRETNLRSLNNSDDLTVHRTKTHFNWVRCASGWFIFRFERDCPFQCSTNSNWSIVFMMIDGRQFSTNRVCELWLSVIRINSSVEWSASHHWLIWHIRQFSVERKKRDQKWVYWNCKTDVKFRIGMEMKRCIVANSIRNYFISYLIDFLRNGC